MSVRFSVTLVQLLQNLHSTTKFCFCSVDGDFTSWSGWSNCSRTCGVGNQERTRSCTSPPQRGEGKNCNGSERESRPCNITLTCPGKEQFVFPGFSSTALSCVAARLNQRF